jgi:hypothetical protein
VRGISAHLFLSPARYERCGRGSVRGISAHLFLSPARYERCGRG